MALAPQADISEAISVLSHCIDSGSELDQLTFRRYLKKFENIPDEPTKLMLFGLAYGAVKEYPTAIAFFKDAVSYKDDVVARNYLTFLGRILHFEMYREESERLAKEYNSFPLCIRARNAAYADGNGELSLFFTRKAISLTSDDKTVRRLEMEAKHHIGSLDKFASLSGLSSRELQELSRSVTDVARKHGVLSIATEFYVSSDNHDLAIINDVLTMNEDLISDMDIEIACALAMNEKYSDKNVSAWYRGRENVGHTI
ncbi:hypothetical protein V3510_005281 [Serratia marcescens]|nr:hypothetical protein [Serratia marcescens]